MPNVEIKNLPPTPVCAHLGEVRFSDDLTKERMKAIRGGLAVTNFAPIGAMPVQYPGEDILTALGNEFGLSIQLPVDPLRKPGTIQNW